MVFFVAGSVSSQDPWKVHTAAHQALVRGDPMEALELLDEALETLSTGDLAWPYLMERALEAELSAERWEQFDGRLKQLDHAPSKHVPRDIAFQADDARIRAAKRKGLPETVEDFTEQVLAEVRAAYAEDEETKADSELNAYAENLTNLLRTAVDLDLAIGRFDRAVERTDDAFTLRAVQENVNAQARLLKMRALAERQLEKLNPERPRTAHETWRRALELSSLDIERSQIQLSLAEWALDVERYAEARDHLDDVVVRGDRYVALEARWTRLTQAVDPVKVEVHRQLHAALAATIDAWSDMDVQPGGRGSLLFNDQRMLLSEALAAEVLERGASAGLELLARVQAGTTTSRRLGATPSTVEDLVSLLEGDRHGVLVFSPIVSGGSSVFAFDRHGVLHARVPPFGDVEALRRRWMSRLRPAVPASLFKGEPELAASLGALLLPDEIRVRMESWDALSVCGLESWPVAWLGFESDGHVDRWGVRWSLDRWTSLPVVVASSDRWPGGGEAREGHVELFASPDGPDASVQSRWPHAQSLPQPIELVAHVESVYHAVSTHVGPAASVDELLAASARGPSILQFVGHSVTDTRSSEPGMLVLSSHGAGDGLLANAELRHRLAGRDEVPEVVMLLACQSEQLRERVGDPGAASAVGTWLSLGARAIVTTGTDVTFEQASTASAAIHTELARGTSLADALRRRRQHLIEDHGAEAVRLSGLLDAHGLAHRGWTRRPTPASSLGLWPWVIGVSVAAGLWLMARS